MSDPECGTVRIVLHNFRSEVEAPVGTTLLEAVQAAGPGPGCGVRRSRHLRRLPRALFGRSAAAGPGGRAPPGARGHQGWLAAGLPGRAQERLPHPHPGCGADGRHPHPDGRDGARRIGGRRRATTGGLRRRRRHRHDDGGLLSGQSGAGAPVGCRVVRQPAEGVRRGRHLAHRARPPGRGAARRDARLPGGGHRGARGGALLPPRASRRGDPHPHRRRQPDDDAPLPGHRPLAAGRGPLRARLHGIAAAGRQRAGVLADWPERR